MISLETIGQNAKKACKEFSASFNKRNIALKNIEKEILSNKEAIIEANKKDLENGKKIGLSVSLLDRLALNENRICQIANGISQIIELPDPLGKVLDGYVNKSGLHIKKISVPLGVISIIYEARPNVTADAACLCLKSGNAVILKGGKEAINSNIEIVRVMRNALKKSGLNEDLIQIVTDTGRDCAKQLMKLNKYVDVLIPRGGKNLIKTVVENSTVPVIETGSGNCHVYVDKDADIDMACNIIYNAKTSRPSVCNAIETILIHEEIAEEILPKIKDKLEQKNVELRGCEKTRKILNNKIKPATEKDWETEYLDFILAVKVVKDINEATEHISKYSSGHSEAIITNNYQNAQVFTQNVDSAAVYVNASTRFTDGGEFGMGAEIGISTQKLHSRGPMGINQLTSTKFIIEGNGQVRN